jgi:hypothetical protein
MGVAGAPGFEPRSTAPKAGVLPLHHAPVRAKLYHKSFIFHLLEEAPAYVLLRGKLLLN